MNKKSTRQIVLSAMFLSLGYVLPFVTGQIPEIGNMLLPMHFPVLLCGFICGPVWGGIVGFLTPLLRSLTLSMPPMFPTAISMAFELLTYGVVVGIIYEMLPKKTFNIYVSLILAMLSGRVVWGLVRFILVGLNPASFTFSAFMAGAFTSAIPGILLQIIAIPFIMMYVSKRS